MSGIGIATNKKILELFNMMKSGSLILRPAFQRKLVWNDKHKENFIQTILLELPFPEIYLADGEIDLASQTSKTLVVDGQQRLSTIYQYVTESDEFKIGKIKRFSELDKEKKTAFYDYNVVVRDLGRISDQSIIEIFQRINSVQYALNAMEIQNALYEGDYISAAKEIAEKNKYLKDIEVFSDTDFTRMRDLEFILLIMSTLEEGGYFTGTKEIENYVRKFDSIYPNKNNIVASITAVFELIVDAKLSFDSLWLRKSSFFTLVVELLKFKNKHGLLPDAKSLAKALVEFENVLIENKNKEISKNEFAEYYYYTFQGTTGRKGRNVRGDLLGKYLAKLK